MTKQEAIEQLEYVDGMMWINDEYLYKGIEIAIECIQHCIDEEESVCYNCTDKHCDNCLYSGRIN